MKVLLSVQYDGKNYYGWQEQKTPNTVQGKLQEAIYKFCQEKVKIYVAGRTDSGVHALSQIAHFETNTKREESTWQLGLNSHLPDDIRINFVKFISDEFHARFSVISRTYRYVIYNNNIKNNIYGFFCSRFCSFFFVCNNHSFNWFICFKK